MYAPRLSLQLYSVREHLADLDSGLARIAELGIGNVEPFSIFDRTMELIPALARHGLAAPTGHAPFLSDEIEYQGRVVQLPPLAVTLQTATALGLEVLVDPMVPATRWQTADEIARTADRINAAAAQAAEMGLRVAYHNHSFEFHLEIDGRSAYEHFISLLDPRVTLEVDVYWAAVAGQDVAALLRRLNGRVVALHLKDGAIVEDPFASERGYVAEELPLRPLGDGDLDLEGILEATPGVAFDVIEIDHVEGDVFAAIAASVGTLQAGRHVAAV